MYASNGNSAVRVGFDGLLRQLARRQRIRALLCKATVGAQNFVLIVYLVHNAQPLVMPVVVRLSSSHCYTAVATWAQSLKGGAHTDAASHGSFEDLCAAQTTIVGHFLVLAQRTGYSLHPCR